MRKKVLMLVGLMALLLGSVNAQRTLEIYITGLTEDTMTWFREVAFPAFEAEHPDVIVDILTGGWGDFDAAVRAGSPRLRPRHRLPRLRVRRHLRRPAFGPRPVPGRLG